MFFSETNRFVFLATDTDEDTDADSLLIFDIQAAIEGQINEGEPEEKVFDPIGTCSLDKKTYNKIHDVFIDNEELSELG